MNPESHADTAVETANRRGFALMEALVAVAVLMLVATVFVLLVNQGHSGVFFASHFVRVLYEAQGQVDAALGSDQATGEELDLQIQFPGVGIMDVSGETISVPVEFGGRSTFILVFDPRK